METSVKINDPKSIPKLQCAAFLLLHCISFFVGGRVRVQIYPVIEPNIKKSNQLKAQKQTKNVPRRPCTEIKRQKNGVLKPNKNMHQKS